MKRSVIADTGPLYAAIDKDDSHHKRARRELQQLARDQFEVVIPYPTLLEACTLVMFRLGKNAAATWLREMKDAVLINPGPADYQRSFLRVQGMQDQAITLFDAVLASLAVRLDLPVWTYDHHFDSMGIEVWH